MTNTQLTEKWVRQHGDKGRLFQGEETPVEQPRGKTIIQKEFMFTMFIEALVTAARTWKQPKCPSTDEWIKKMWRIYAMEYYSAIRKE